MNCRMRIEVSEGKLKELLDKLDNALETIRWCYSNLRDLGVVVMKEETTSTTDGLPSQD